MIRKVLSELVGARLAKKLPEDIGTLAMMSTDDLRQRGLSAKAAAQVKASVVLARMVGEPVAPYATRITSPQIAVAYCLAEFTELRRFGKQEEFHIITLDTKNQPLRRHQITVGTLRNSLVHPREVFRPAIADAANCIICCHNHPSGDTTPSDVDISVTERLESAAEIIGIPVIDHIIVAGENGLSIQEYRHGGKSW